MHMVRFEGFSKITKGIGQGAKAATKMAGDTMEITKFRKDIAANRADIDKLYLEIGKNVYEKYRASTLIEEELIGMCRDIDEIHNEINELEKKVLELKNLKKCPGCGNELAKDSQFCPDCGTKQDE